VALPSLEIVLVENQRKRANFLKNVIRSMQLQGLRSVHSRVEDLGDSFQNKFDFIVLRHVKDFKASLEMGRALLCSEGRIVIQKEVGAPSPELEFLHFHSEIPLIRPGRSPSKLMVFQRFST
jgi:16S rRNA G527 N7-methylase RsmG